MYSSEIFSNYGLIGDNLELKRDIKLEIDENGNFKRISYKNVGDTIHLSDNNSNLLLVPGLINSHIHIPPWKLFSQLPISIWELNFIEKAGFYTEFGEISQQMPNCSRRLLGLIQKTNHILKDNSISKKDLRGKLTDLFLDVLSNSVSKDSLESIIIHINNTGNYTITIELELQIWFGIGLIISALSLIVIGFGFILQWIRDSMKRLHD